ncbi:MAG TPA: pilus assembly protein TadG-related protein [Marmoricola sp.]
MASGRRGRLRRKERGAMAIFLALTTCFVLVPLGALVVDIGMQRVARRDMQSLADTTALDMARTLAAGATPSNADAQASADRNGASSGAVGGIPAMKVYAGYVGASTTFDATAGQGLGCGASPYNSYFRSPPAGVPANAVLVTATGSVNFAIHGGSGRVCRSSIALDDRNACYKAGSFALGLATNKSILAPILGDAAAARVLSYNGIATASVSLLDLAAAPQIGVGTPDQLLTAPNVTVGNILDASASLLSNDGNTADAAVAAQLLNLKADLGSLAGDKVNIGSILDIGQGNGSSLDSQVNVLDLITGGLIVANGVNAVSVPGLNVTALGSTLQAKLWISEPPVLGCNGGGAKAAQGYVQLTGDITLLGLATLKNVSITVSLANATATLDESGTCSVDAIKVNVTDQTLANVRLQADINALSILGGGVKIGSIDTGAPSPTSGGSYTLNIPDAYTNPVTTNSGTIGLQLNNAAVTVVGLNVSALVTALAPLVSAVDSMLTQTLLPALGITTAGADLWAMPTPTCDTPRLVG